MRKETFFDPLEDTGKYNFIGWRCLICGEILDAVILANRKFRHRRIGPGKRNRILVVN